MGNRKVKNKHNFRNIVRSRDNWTCQKCGRIEYVQAHHIDHVKDYPLFQNLSDNGITLCVYCHADAVSPWRPLLVAHPEVPRNLFIANVSKAEKEGCISAGRLAKELGVHPRTIVRKAVKLGILKPMQKWIFTKEEANIIRERGKRPQKAGNMMKKPTTLMIDSRLYSTIKLLAVLKKVSIFEVIEEALKLYLLSQKEIIETLPQRIPDIEKLLVEKTNPTTGEETNEN